MDRRVYYTLFATIMASALGASLVVPLLPVYAQSLGASGLGLGMIFSGFAVARTIILPWVGQLGDSRGRKRLIMLGLFIYLVVAVGFDLASSLVQLILCRILQGAGAAMVIPMARAYVGDLTPAGREGSVMGHFNIAFYAGLTLGPWLGGYLKDSLGLSASFYSMAVLAFFGLVLSGINLPRSSAIIKKRSQLPPVSYWAMLSIPSLTAIFLFRWGTTIGVGINWAFMPIYAHESLGLSSGVIGMLIGLNLFMTTISQPLFGWLADRWSRTLMIFFGGFAACSALVALPFCRTFNQMLVVNLVIGLSTGAFMPPLMAMAVDAGRRTGFMTKVMSLLEMAFSLAMIMGPMAAGLIKDTWGLKTTFVWGGAFGLFMCLVFLAVVFFSPKSGGSADTSP